jgi:hypothetical protein
MTWVLQSTCHWGRGARSLEAKGTGRADFGLGLISSLTEAQGLYTSGGRV